MISQWKLKLTKLNITNKKRATHLRGSLGLLNLPKEELNLTQDRLKAQVR